MTLSQRGSLLGRVLQREAARWWWAPLVAGAVWFVIAWLVLRLNSTSLTTVGLLLGAVFLIAAINEGALGALMRGGWAVLHYALAVIFVAGCDLVVRPPDQQRLRVGVGPGSAAVPAGDLHVDAWAGPA